MIRFSARVDNLLRHEHEHNLLVARYKSSDQYLNFGSAGDMHTLHITQHHLRLAPRALDSLLSACSAYPGYISGSFDVEHSVVSFLQDKLHIAIEKNEVVLFRGVYDALTTFCTFKKESLVLVPEVLNAGQVACFLSQGKEVRTVRQDESDMLALDDLEQILLQEQGNIAFIYLNHNRGLGLSSEYIGQLVKLVNKYSVTLLYDADALFTVHKKTIDPLTILRDIAVQERTQVMVLCNMSKELGAPGLRLGFGITHPNMAASVREFQDNSLCIFPTPSKYIAKLLLEHVSVSEIKKELENRMHMSVGMLRDLGWPITTPGFGINLFVPAPISFCTYAKDVSAGELFSYYLLKYAGIRVRPAIIHGKKLRDLVRFVISLAEADLHKVKRQMDEARVYYHMPYPENLERDYLEEVKARPYHHAE